MDAIDCLVSRRSTRRYLRKAVEFDKVMMCLEAATKAPTSGNIQDYRFIIITDQQSISEIAEHCAEQYWIQEAPVLIVVAVDTDVAETHYGLRGQRLYSIQNAAAATQNILLTAHALGLGTCWIGVFDEGYLGDKLKMSDKIRPQAIITIGYPAEQPGEKPEKPLRQMIFFNEFGGTVKNMNTLLREYNKEIERIYKDISKKVEKGGDSAFHKLKRGAKKLYEKTKEKR